LSQCSAVIPRDGINALDLVGPKASGDDFADAKAMIEINYGVDVPPEKIKMLFTLMKEDGWSRERLQKTTKWFLKNKKWPTWTIADWFEFGVKLFPYSWYQEQISKGTKAEDMEGYKVNGKVLWKLKDGQELPFEKVGEK
jgi:hypothetical protein